MLKWIFGADISPFKKGLAEMREETKKLSENLKGQLASALGLGSIVALFGKLLVEMSRVQDLADRFGETAETIQKVGMAAKLSGSDLEGVAKALTVVTKNAYEAATGNNKFAEAFATLGIDASKFVNLPMEEKLLLLAGAMEESRGDGEKLALAMKILGKSGGDLVPLLAQGRDALKEVLDNTDVVDGATVKAIEEAGDLIEILKNKALVAAGAVVGGFRLIGTVAKAAIDQTGTVMEAGFATIINLAVTTGKVIESALTFDVKGVKDAMADFDALRKANASRLAADTKANADKLKEGLGDVLDAKPAGPAKDLSEIENQKEAAEEAKKAEEEKQKIEEKRAALKEKIADFEQEQRLKAMEGEARLVELVKLRASAMEKVRSSTGEEALKAEEEAFALTKEIAKTEQELAKEKEKAAEDLAKKQKDLAQEIADMEEEAAMRKLSTEEKILALQAKRAALVASLEGKTGVAAMEIRKKILETDEQIDPLKAEARKKKEDDLKKLRDDLEDVNKEKPAIVASSLAQAGGGGPAAIFGDDAIQRRQEDLLKQIRDLLASGDGNSAKPIPPS